MPSIATIAAEWGRPADCWKCGSARGLTRAHLVAVMHDGTDDPENLALLCENCHAVQPKEWTDRADAIAWLDDGMTGDESMAAYLVARLVAELEVDPATTAATAELLRGVVVATSPPRTAAEAVMNFRIALGADALDAEAERLGTP
jgi:hypothetical protein